MTIIRGLLTMWVCFMSLSVFAGEAGDFPPPPPEAGNGPPPGLGPMGPPHGNPLAMISRMTGIDIENTAACIKDPKLETLPLGSQRRLVINVPVGGIENPAGTGAGWKMEAVFNLSQDQQRTLQTLRDEYDGEKRKLQKELGDIQRQMAQKAIQVRLQYEERANGLLASADKQTKLKMDALTADAGAKSDALIKDALNLYDPETPEQGFALVKYLREKMNDFVTQTEKSLLQLVPVERKPVIEEVVRNNIAARQEMPAFGHGGGPREEPTEKPPEPKPDPKSIKPNEF